MTSILVALLALRCASPVETLREAAVRLSELKVEAFHEAQQHNPPPPGGLRAFGAVPDDGGFATRYYEAISDLERAAWQAVANAEKPPDTGAQDQ